MDGKKIYVNNIHQMMTRDDLHKAFQHFGTISACIKKLRGYGTVRFETEEVAARARREMNRKNIKGSIIRCSWEKPQQEQNALNNSNNSSSRSIGNNINNTPLVGTAQPRSISTIGAATAPHHSQQLDPPHSTRISVRQLLRENIQRDGPTPSRIAAPVGARNAEVLQELQITRARVVANIRGLKEDPGVTRRGGYFLGPDDPAQEADFDFIYCRHRNNKCPRCPPNEAKAGVLKRSPYLRRPHYQKEHPDIYFALKLKKIKGMEKFLSSNLGIAETETRVCTICEKTRAHGERKKYYCNREELLIHKREDHRTEFNRLKRDYIAERRRLFGVKAEQPIHDILTARNVSGPSERGSEPVVRPQNTRF